MNDENSSLCQKCFIRIFHDQFHHPFSDRKFDCIWIAGIFLPSFTKSKIYKTLRSIRCARSKIKVHFTRLFRSITGIGRKIWRIFFQKIGRLLKRERNSSLFAENNSEGKKKHQENSQKNESHVSMIRIKTEKEIPTKASLGSISRAHQPA